MDNTSQENQASFQILYYQLLSQYYVLAENYHNQAEQNFKLFQQLEGLLSEKLNLTKEQIPTQANIPITPQPQQECSFNQLKQAVKEQPKKNTKKQHKIRRQVRIYQCPYTECSLVYRSSVSMNLHIKLKHKGGTKKQRQAVAKILIQAEEKGLPSPEIDMNLPPNFIQEFKKNYQYAKKYNM